MSHINFEVGTMQDWFEGYDKMILACLPVCLLEEEENKVSKSAFLTPSQQLRSISDFKWMFL